MVGRKRKLREDPDPYLVQHHPLSPDQLCAILGANESEVAKAVVPQVPEPRAGQVFLVDCAGARFARYDSHRWTAYHHHTGLGPLLPPSQTDPLGDWVEVRYNKKLGTHGNLGQGAMRIVYKLKAEERHMLEAPAVSVAPFHIIQYLEELPAQVESAITLQLEEENAKIRMLEETQRKEKEAVEKKKNVEEIQGGESKFGRRRKPNSRYSELYTLEATSGKAASSESQSDEEPPEAEPTGDTYGFLKMSGIKGSAKGQRRAGRLTKTGSGRGFRDTSRTWLAGYGLERSKPKSSSLFQMCDDDDDDGDDDDDDSDAKEGGSDENESSEEPEEDDEEEEEDEEEVWSKESTEDMKNADTDMADLPQLLGYGIDLSPHASDSPTTDEVKITITHSDPGNPVCSDTSNTGDDAVPVSSPVEKACESPAEDSKAEGLPARRRRCPGRPRYRALEKRSLKTRKEDKEEEEEKEREDKDEGKKLDYCEDEARPFKFHHRGRLFHADAEDIFRQAVKGKIEVHRLGVKKPKAGGLYLLDKGFVPFSDSLPWVREYYYRSHEVLMERFGLRDLPHHLHPLHPTTKTLFTHSTPNTTLCLVHYQKPEKSVTQTEKEKTKAKKRNKKKENNKMKTKPRIYTESNANLNLSLVEAMLTRPDLSRLVSAPVLNPQPFQVYLLGVPTHNTCKVLDNYCWTDKGFKRWPTDSSGSATRLLCYHSPMRVTRSAMCAALMRHEFRLPSPGAQDVRVVHYMPTREFREYVVIANAARQMQKVTQAAWHNPPVAEDVAPLQISSSRLRPSAVWELLTQGTISTVILAPQAGGIYLTSLYDNPDLLEWEDLAQLQIQPRVYQVMEVCQKVTDDESRLIRLRYTSPKVPYKALLHYLGDPRPYLDSDLLTTTTTTTTTVAVAGVDDDPLTGMKDLDQTTIKQQQQQQQCKEGDGEGGVKEEAQENRTSSQLYLKEEHLYRISPRHLQEVGCVALKPEDLDVEVETAFQQPANHVEEALIPPDKVGLYHYGHRMMKKRIVRLLENLDRSRKIQLPIKNPEAGEAYLVTKPTTNKTPVDPYKWTQKGWQPIPRKEPLVLWRWGLLRHKKHTWAPPLIRIDYVHVVTNTDMMLVHYVPTKDNEHMLEIRSSTVPLRTETHSLLSMGDVNFGQHSQLLTNSPLPPSHIWELLSAGGGLTQPITEPQPGGVYVTNMDSKDKLDLYSWKVLGDIRLSSNDYGLLETSAVVEWGSGEVKLGRLTYHTPLIRARTVIHYLGDCRPYLDRAKNEEQERLKRLEAITKIASPAATLDLTHLEVSGSLGSARGDGMGRDPATEAVGSILAGLGSNIMDSDTLNQTFAELGGEVEGLCEGSPSTASPSTTRLEDQHLQDSALPPIQVAYGSISTTSLVNQLFPEGLPKITVQKVLEVEEGEAAPLRKRRSEHLLELPEMKIDIKEEERGRLRGGPYRAIPRTLQDWNEEEEGDDSDGGEGQRKTRLQITTTESRTIVYIRQHHTLTEKQLDHFLCNPDVSRISFLPLIDPQPGDVYVVAIPYRKGEVRRLDCHNWYVTGHKKGKFRRTYSYIRDQEGNTSHRLLRYTYDYAWEDSPGLRVVHYIPGDPRHQVLCCGKKPNYEEEPEGKGSGPLYRAYTASMTHRDVLLIMNDPPLYHVCDLPIRDPKAGEVYIIKAPSLALAQRESMYDNLTWTEGQVKNVGGKRPALRKTKYLSFDPTDGTRSDAFVRVTWERLLDPSEVTAQLGGHRRQPLVIIHYLGDETMAGEMVRRGKDGTLHLRQIRHYIETGSYLPSVHITEKNGIRKSAKKFIIENNTLYYVGKDRREMRLVLYTNEEKNKVFEECHIIPKTGEHCGRTKTLKRLSEKYYWTSMVEDVVAMIVRCKACEFSKLNRPNQRFVRVTEPWEVVSVDIIGQFVASGRGNAFVAVIIDMFTKYTVVVPLRDTTVSDLTSALQTAVFLQGPPRKFISDQNEEFVQELSLELDMRLGVNVVAVSKAQMNRPDEANIKTTILHHCLEAEADWDELLQKKVYEINTEYVTASGYTPFYLMFHREARPVDGSLSLRVSSSSKPTFVVRDIEPYMEERDQRASEILNQVLTGQPPTERTKVYLEEVGAGAEETGGLLSGVDVGGDYHPHQTTTTHVQVVAGPDQDHSHYTHVTHLPEAQVLDEGGGSVYEMGDGEGHVVVVAGGMAGLEGGGEGGEEEEGQHMVVVQPGVGDQGVIMLAENQVIMDAVTGQQFTYLPSS